MLKFSRSEEDLMLNCEYSKKLLSKLEILNSSTPNKIDIPQIRRAICYAKYYHSNQRRLSGEPYYSHPLEVAYMVSDYLFRTDIIVTSILHDTIEDTKLNKEMISKRFGEKIAEQVYDLSPIKANNIKITSSEMVEILWQQKKYDILIIKLLDRIHNIETISAKCPEKIKKIITETLQKFIILSEALELPGLSDYIYKRCYEANIKHGFVHPIELKLDKQFSFDNLSSSQNNQD